MARKPPTPDLPPRQSDEAAAIVATFRPRPAPEPPPFLITKEHRRFLEFADTVRRNRYIGVCVGPPGIGKTLSARTYSGAAEWGAWFEQRWKHDSNIPEIIETNRTAMWTPHITTTPRELEREVPALCQQVSWAVECHHNSGYDPLVYGSGQGCAWTELLIVDEADRLKTAGLEQLRDFFDRHHLGLILIGMPGLEKQLARYPQLYSRVGFAHHYRPLSIDELTFVLARHWDQIGHTLDAEDFTDTEAVAARRRRPDHWRQLPANRTPVHPDPARHRDQRAAHHHTRRSRSCPQHPRNWHLTCQRAPRVRAKYRCESHTSIPGCD